MCLSKVVILYEFLKVVFQRTCVLSSGEPCGTRCTSKSCQKRCVFKTFPKKYWFCIVVCQKSLFCMSFWKSLFKKHVFCHRGSPQNRGQHHTHGTSTLAYRNENPIMLDACLGNNVFFKLSIKKRFVRCFSKQLIFYMFLKIIFPKAYVFSSGQPRRAGCTFKSGETKCAVKICHERLLVSYGVLRHKSRFAWVSGGHFSKTMCFFIGGTPRNRMQPQTSGTRTLSYMNQSPTC